jgi:hypothetical protein
VWPEAEFIVGNPPFIGAKFLRERLSSAYVEALWAAHNEVNESADFVLHWWDRAAELLTRRGTKLRRFGLVTTNSITQEFQRRVVDRHLRAKRPVTLVFAIPDHPWTKATRDAAAVRIAMTALEAGRGEGVLWRAAGERHLDTDAPAISFATQTGQINSDLTVGMDVTKASALLSNNGLCSPGVKLHGSGFIVPTNSTRMLGLGARPGLERHIRSYRNGRDITDRPRQVSLIDLYGLTAEEVRRSYPEVYQRVLETVKPERDANNRASYRENWWIFGEPRSELRPALENISRYTATPVTQKHRFFVFLDAEVMPDDALMCIADETGLALAVLSSRIYSSWFRANSSTLEDRPRFIKSRCFDPFPFPNTEARLHSGLCALADELDGTRKLVLAENADLTLTGLYNVLEKVNAGIALTPAQEDAKQRGRVLILKELHEQIDALTAQAYGWPADLSDEQILERLVALNAERAKEEAAGHVRWLRPDYQIPRFAKGAAAKTGDLDLGETVVPIDKGLPTFPKDRYEQPLAIEAMLAAANRPMDAAELSRGFKRGGKLIEQRIVQVLTTLARYGRVSVLADGKYAARRAA